MSEGEWPALKPCVEYVFKAICNQDGAYEKEASIKNYRLTKQNLKKYLTGKYNTRFAGKIAALFDFSNPLDYKGFYQQFEQTFINM